MVPFAGYEMPVQYQGIIAEHQHTRQKAGLFDVSHMGQATLEGDDPAAAIETLVPGDIQGLSAHHIRYTMLTNDQGGILDDLMVTRRSDKLFLVVNASRKVHDFGYIRSRLEDRCTLTEHEDRSLLALQGPASAAVLARLAPASRHLMFMASQTLAIGGMSVAVTRSGYTGEDGFEISVAAEDADHLARLLLGEEEVMLAGLGARDSLRLEAGLCLYGNDIDETTTPIEAGLAWTISKRRREEGGFPGADVILDQLAKNPARKRVGIRPQGKAPARAHAEITDGDGSVIGEITSGGFGPTVGGPVAMGYVAWEHAKVGTAVNLMVRGKALPGKIEKLPFTEHRYSKS